MLGWRLRLSRPGYALALQGGGIGILYLVIEQAGPSVASGLKVAADISQALVAAVITVYVVYGVVGMFMKRTREKPIVGTAAKFAERLGGTKETPMQA